MLTEEIKKSIEEIVETSVAQTLKELEEKEEITKSEEKEEEDKSEEEEKSEEVQEEKVEKSETEEESEEDEELEKGKGMPKEKMDANGGDDKIKSGTPKTEKQKMMDKSNCMKKSIEELSEHLDADELELIQAWRAQESDETVEVEETVAKSLGSKEEGLAETIAKAITAQMEDLKKAISDKEEMIKSLTDKVEKMASQPAYDKRSVDSLEHIEKSGDSDSSTITKAQVLDTMLDLQKSGKGVTSYHISEFEATQNITDPRIKELVWNTCKNK